MPPTDHEIDLLAEIADPSPEQDRIAAALADLDSLLLTRPAGTPSHRTHNDHCWRWHTGCLAARIRRTLTGDTDHG